MYEKYRSENKRDYQKNILFCKIKGGLHLDELNNLIKCLSGKIYGYEEEIKATMVRSVYWKKTCQRCFKKF